MNTPNRPVPELHAVLAVLRSPAADRLRLLMGRMKLADLTPSEILALVAVFESADQRVNAPAAPVLELHTRDGLQHAAWRSRRRHPARPARSLYRGRARAICRLRMT